MRAALCFSGRATKGSEATIANLKKYFITPLMELGYEVDCFGHFWKIQDYEQAVDAFDKLMTEVEIEEDQSDVLQKRLEENCNFVADMYPYTANMFYSIYRANELRHRHGEYDLVARMRTDNVCTEGSYKSELAKCVGATTSEIFFPRNYKMKGTVPHSNFWYIVDNFAIGGSAALDSYARTYWNIPATIAMGQKKWPGKTSWACGTLLGTQLVRDGINRRLELEPGITVVRTWDAWLQKEVRRGNTLKEPAKEWLAAKKEMGMEDWSFKANRT